MLSSRLGRALCGIGLVLIAGPASAQRVRQISDFVVTHLDEDGYQDLAFATYDIVIPVLDGDGRADVAIGHWRPMVGVRIRNRSHGTLGAVKHFASHTCRGIAVDDLDGDGRADLIVATSNGVEVLLNKAPTLFSFLPDKTTLTWPAVSGTLSYNVYRGVLDDLTDTDEDGLPDGGYGTCRNAFDPDPTDREFVDAEVPPVGSGWFYLMSVTDWEGERDLRSTSAGLPRVPTVACP